MMVNVNIIDTWPSHRWQRGNRYYEAQLKRDLFGWVVVRQWGGVGQRTGREMTLPVPTYEVGLNELKAIFKRRKKRNYRLVDCYLKKPNY